LTTIVQPEAGIDPWLLFREKKSQQPDQPETSSDHKTVPKAEKAVLCRACRTVVTRLNAEISVNGKHMHTFFNPAGIVYEIRCFSQAPGCLVHGKPTDEFTWFSGYTWEYCLCGTCSDHLGWFYSSSGSSFYGLINCKLIIDEPLS
jgi:hypothetical protein